MTKYSVSMIKDFTHESLALFDSKCNVDDMIGFARSTYVNPVLGPDDVYLMDLDTGEILWNAQDEEEDYYFN